MFKIAYLIHPVSEERKRKFVSDGYKIVDIRFKPDDLREEDFVDVDDEKESIIAQLEELGEEVNKRLGLAKLKNQLKEAQSVVNS